MGRRSRDTYPPTGDECFRITGELAVSLPALIRTDGLPTVRDLGPSEAVVLELATIVSTVEEVTNRNSMIVGEEYLRRISLAGDYLPLGYQHREWLSEHWRESATLVSLLGEVEIHFPGSICVRGDGVRRVPTLRTHFPRLCDGGGPPIWIAGWHRLDLGFLPSDRIAVARHRN